VREQPSFAEIIHAMHPDYFPAMINAGIGGDEIHDCWGVAPVSYKRLKHAGDIHLYLEQNPDIRFWCIGFGTNDWWEKPDGFPNLYKEVYQKVITEILKAGRIPIIAQIPFARAVEDPKSPYQNIPTCLNPSLQELTAENNLIPGPDLYNYFKSNRWFLSGDSLHPGIAGCNAMNEMWANLASDFYDTPEGTPYDKWKTASFGADAGNPAISGDAVVNNNAGIPNLMAYALGINPVSATVNQLPAVQSVVVSGTTYLGLTFARNADAVDIAYTVEGSNDLTNWSTVSAWSGGSWSPSNFVTETGSGSNLNVLARDSTPATSAPKRFLRLQVIH